MPIAGNINDLEIIESIKRGEERSIGHLYNIGKDFLERFVLNNNGDYDDAQEVIQDAVLIMYEKISQNKFVLNQNTRLSTYMMGVGKNMWYKRLKAKGLSNTLLLNTDYDYELESDNLSEERFVELEKAIMQLDERCREIIRQRYWLKKRFEVIAAELLDSIPSLKMKSSRCHNQLKLKLNGR